MPVENIKNCFENGDKVVLKNDLVGFSIKIKKGTVVTVTGRCERGYSIVTEEGHRLIECGFDIGDEYIEPTASEEPLDEDEEYCNSEDQDVYDMIENNRSIKLSYTAEDFANFMTEYYTTNLSRVQRLGQAFHAHVNLSKFMDSPEKEVCDAIYEADSDKAIELICKHLDK